MYSRSVFKYCRCVWSLHFCNNVWYMYRIYTLGVLLQDHCVVASPVLVHYPQSCACSVFSRICHFFGKFNRGNEQWRKQLSSHHLSAENHVESLRDIQPPLFFRVDRPSVFNLSPALGRPIMGAVLIGRLWLLIQAWSEVGRLCAIVMRGRTAFAMMESVQGLLK